MRVEKTKENLQRCLCMSCPSYTMGCKLKNMPENLVKMFEDFEQLDHFESMYCAFDKSHCIEHDKDCICSKCQNYKDYNLHNEDYCLKTGGI